MLNQGFVMVFWALKPVVKLIYADCALVQLILAYDKVVFVLHLTKQVKIHVTLLQTYHEILVIQEIYHAVKQGLYFVIYDFPLDKIQRKNLWFFIFLH